MPLEPDPKERSSHSLAAAELVSNASIVLLEMGNIRIHARLEDDVDLVKFYCRLFYENSTTKKEMSLYLKSIPQSTVQELNKIITTTKKKNENLKKKVCVK